MKGKTKRLKIFPPVDICEQPIPAAELLAHEAELLIGCGEKALVLSDIQLEGSKRISAKAFKNSL